MNKKVKLDRQLTAWICPNLIMLDYQHGKEHSAQIVLIVSDLARIVKNLNKRQKESFDYWLENIKPVRRKAK